MATTAEVKETEFDTTAVARILVADDQADVREALRLLLKGEDYEIETVGSPAALLESLERRPFDLVLMDLNYARGTTSGQEGLDLLPAIRSRDVALPVVVIRRWLRHNSVQTEFGYDLANTFRTASRAAPRVRTERRPP